MDMMDDERPAVIKHYEPTYIMAPSEDNKYVLQCAPLCRYCYFAMLMTVCGTSDSARRK